MKIAVLGTGGVGRAFAKKLIELGHSVTMGTRNIEKTTSLMADFLNDTPSLLIKTFADAASEADIVINVSKGQFSVDIFSSIPSNFLNQKIIIDISNPLDFSNGMPPSLFPQWSNTNSLGEEIQKTHPNSFVVKTLNTMWNGLMLNPNLINEGNHVNYICGNSHEAKTKVIHLLNEFGWRNENILDLGDITASRATEATLPIWLRIYGTKKSGSFNFSIVG
jgi:8-hydroxy-5-deazaflavin:NADPH oxidoreductase